MISIAVLRNLPKSAKKHNCGVRGGVGERLEGGGVLGLVSLLQE